MDNLINTTANEHELELLAQVMRNSYPQTTVKTFPMGGKIRMTGHSFTKDFPTREELIAFTKGALRMLRLVRDSIYATYGGE